MVAASKKPVSELVDIIGQINRIQGGGKSNIRGATKRNHLDAKILRDNVNIVPTERYTLLNNGELMATIYTGSKIAVFYHPAHYVYKKDFEDRLKPLVDYLFRKRYVLMSEEEYEERTKSGNN
jgi:hypothetical protein